MAHGTSRMTAVLVGRRLKALREAQATTQADLADRIGFKDRQTVSALETGQRRMTADELLRAADALNVPLEHFTDPFLLIGEGRFSWRHSGANAAQLEACERHAGRWIATFRTLAPAVNRPPPLLRHALGLDRHARFEDAMDAGERFAKLFRLGDVPAARLVKVMEEKLGVLVLMLDPKPHGRISGAACRLPGLSAALIARREAAGLRHFNLAHELFHLLTWDAMPPEHSETATEVGGQRVEQLANNFAGAVLMPASVLAHYGSWDGLARNKLMARLNDVATEMQVAASALKWRLVALGSLPQQTASKLSDAALRRNGRRATAKNGLPPLFSKPFVEVIKLAIDKGLLSYRRAAGLLEMSMRDFSELCAAHQLPPPDEL